MLLPSARQGPHDRQEWRYGAFGSRGAVCHQTWHVACTHTKTLDIEVGLVLPIDHGGLAEALVGDARSTFADIIRSAKRAGDGP